MARSEGGASPSRSCGITTEQHRQLPFCLAPSTVALILALAFVARWAEIAADIGAALRALANAKIHSNAIHSSISTASWGQNPKGSPTQNAGRRDDKTIGPLDWPR